MALYDEDTESYLNEFRRKQFVNSKSRRGSERFPEAVDGAAASWCAREGYFGRMP